MSERPAEAIERILGEIEDADDVLRGAVAALVTDPDVLIGWDTGGEAWAP